MECVLRHNWKGNVRELRTAMEHGVVMAQKDQITVRDLPQSVRDSIDEIGDSRSGFSNAPQSARSNVLNLHDSETRLIMRALEDTDGNRTEAAKKLGISRRTLHRRLHELNIS
jgi:DNA-binding NtrC family response regulator